MEFNWLGKTLLIFGVILAACGLFLMFLPKIPYIGKLPGDFYFKKGNFTFYFPLATCIILSILISLLLYIFRK